MNSLVQAKVDVVAAVAMTVAAVTLTAMAISNLRGSPSQPFTPSTTSQPPPSRPVSLDGLQTKGNANAPVVLVVYSDFECPFCARFASSILPEIDKEFVANGRLQLAFSHLPLETIHLQAVNAAVAAECAAREDMFWPMHDRLFNTSDRLDRTRYLSIADELGLGADFEDCLDDGSLIEVVRSVAQRGQELGLKSTPTWQLGLLQEATRVAVRVQMSGLPQSQLLRRLILDLVDEVDSKAGGGTSPPSLD